MPSVNPGGGLASSEAGRPNLTVVEKVTYDYSQPVKVSGKKPIDKGLSYEQNIRQYLYENISFKKREYVAIVDGKNIRGVADCIVLKAGRTIAIEAKFVDKWEKSIRNPSSINGTKPWALKEQTAMIEQAKKYTAAFDEVIYHTNSQEFANHYSQIFADSGINNYKFIITEIKF